ncbi:MAG: hypothetical protein U9N87_14800 [Planctomycetota bacterium]|nr:hypothetical protein [Planctomycetota bacterium]
MAISSEHITGFAAGLGASALGFYLYKQNQNLVDDWLRQQGINLPQSGVKNETGMSLEELTREKERLEDLIAEREIQSKEAPAVEPAE